MVREMFKVDPRHATAFDYVLVLVAQLCAIYSLAKGVGELSLFAPFAVPTAVGMILSFMLSNKLRKSPAIKFDGILFAFAGISAFIFTRQLNTLLPPNPFRDQLVVASALAWLIVSGSFFAWQDGSLLFGSVPAVALFGLVGIWDTFQGIIGLFFTFILCLALMLGRAHSRQMSSLAERSGFLRVERLKEGPWRWMAGAEWAVASGIAIILLSLLGAPIVRLSTSSLNGIAKSNLIPKPNVTPVPNVVNEAAGRRIGTGPSNLGDAMILLASLEKPHYLISGTFEKYEDSGWTSTYDFEFVPGRDQWGPAVIARDKNSHPIIEEFKIRPLTPLSVLPTPGDVIDIEAPGISDATMFRRKMDGTVLTSATAQQGITYKGSAYLTAELVKPDYTGQRDKLPRFLETRGMDQRVLSKAVEIAGAVNGNDYEKARALKSWIESNCKYNLKARPTPTNQDAVAFFLFDSKEGYCDLFASSMVHMARAIGIPARYSVGFYPVRGEKDSGDWYVIRARDAHAWAELYFEGVGWVPFDATEGAAQVEGSSRGSTNEGTNWIQFGAIALAALASAGIMINEARKFRSKMQSQVRDEAILRRRSASKIYLSYERLLQKNVGRPRKLGQTPHEYLDAAKDQLGEYYLIAEDLNKRFETALFAPELVSDEELEELKNDVSELKSLVGSKK